jgi:hypothetical protein
MLRRKSILALQKVTKELTKENVNNYRNDERVDDPEVPLYSAIKLGAALGEADEVEKILRLHPNVFLGVKDEDQQYFSKTAIGLAYELYEQYDRYNILYLVEKYMEEVLHITDIICTEAEDMWEDQRKPPPKRETYYRTKSITQRRYQVHPTYETPPALASKPKANAHPRFKNLRH